MKKLKQLICALLFMSTQPPLFAGDLHNACKWTGPFKDSALSSAKFLIEHHNFDINKPDVDGNTPLHFAVQNNHLELVDYLLSFEHIDLEIRNTLRQDQGGRIGDNVFDIAWRNNYTLRQAQGDRVETLLVEKKIEQLFTLACQKKLPFWNLLRALEDLKKKQKRITCIKRKKKCSLKSLEYLVEHGIVDITKRFRSGEHPIDIACKYALHQGSAELSRSTQDCRALVFLVEKLEERRINFRQQVLDTEIIFDACKKGKFATVQKLIEIGYNIEWPDKYFDTLLHKAVKYKQVALVEYLIQNGANVHMINRRWSTPVFVAIDTIKDGYLVDNTESLQIIRLILNRDKSLLWRIGNQGYTPLHYACDQNKLEVVKLLVEEYDASINILTRMRYKPSNSLYGKKQYTPLEIAQQKNYYGQDSVFKYLQKVQRQQISNIYNACKDGNLEVVKHYIEKLRYPVMTKTHYNENTFLHIACKHGQLEVVRYLLEKEANLESFNGDGQTPLSLATMHGHTHIVRYILQQQKSLLDKNDQDGLNPLHYACQNGNLEMATLLVSSFKANINILTKKTSTPSIFLSFRKNDQTPLSLAKEKNHTGIVEFLERVALEKESHQDSSCLMILEIQKNAQKKKKKREEEEEEIEANEDALRHGTKVPAQDDRDHLEKDEIESDEEEEIEIKTLQDEEEILGLLETRKTKNQNDMPSLAKDLKKKEEKTSQRSSHISLGLSTPASIPIYKWVQKEKIAHYKCACQKCPGPRFFRNKESISVTADGKFHCKCLSKASIPKRSKDFAFWKEFQKIPILELIASGEPLAHTRELLEQIGYTQEEIESLEEN